MMFPAASQSMTFAARPISSTTSERRCSTPISSRPVSSRTQTRSHSGWRSASILAPVRCLRSSIQNIGGACGFSGFSPV